jgi:membrane protease YdiL (CAAX protease family)
MNLTLPLRTTFQSTPTRMMGAIWLVSAAVLAMAGQITWLLMVTATDVFYLGMTWVSMRVAGPAAAAAPAAQAAPGERRKIWVQIGVLLAIILAIGLNAFKPAFSVPLWNDMVTALGALGERILPVAWVGGPANAVANPVQYFVIPLVLLLALGASFRELGFAPGQRSWWVSAAWLVIPLIVFAVMLLTDGLTLPVLGRRLLGNSLQNGFFEEFLFRGALQTRLSKVVSPLTALIAQALLFGAWHVASNTRGLDGSLLTGLAACFVSQAVIGLCAGLLFQRTRNLLAPSVMHVVMNTLASTLG